LDNTIYEAQAAKGKNIQCFIGRQNSVNSFNSFQKDDSKKTSICLSHICKTFLNDHSDIFKCWMINDKCSRLHATKEEAKSYAQEVLSIIERSKNLLPGFKKEFIEKWNLFCESE
jgi:Leu/Phe-tRNA-protein transferase